MLCVYVNSIIWMIRLGDGKLGLIVLVVHLVYIICMGVILVGWCYLGSDYCCCRHLLVYSVFYACLISISW